LLKKRRGGERPTSAKEGETVDILEGESTTAPSYSEKRVSCFLLPATGERRASAGRRFETFPELKKGEEDEAPCRKKKQTPHQRQREESFLDSRPTYAERKQAKKRLRKPHHSLQKKTKKKNASIRLKEGKAA